MHARYSQTRKGSPRQLIDWYVTTSPHCLLLSEASNDRWNERNFSLVHADSPSDLDQSNFYFFSMHLHICKGETHSYIYNNKYVFCNIYICLFHMKSKLFRAALRTHTHTKYKKNYPQTDFWGWEVILICNIITFLRNPWNIAAACSVVWLQIFGYQVILKGTLQQSPLVLDSQSYLHEKRNTTIITL